MRIKNHKDFFSGLIFMAAGVAFAWGAGAYTIGTGAQMGPGYFPLVLGVALALLGGLLTFKALVVETLDGHKIGPLAYKPLFFIITANVAYGVMLGGLPRIGLPPMGVVAGAYVLTCLASGAGDKPKPLETLLLASVLAVVSYLAFIVWLKLPLRVWPAFISA